MAINFDMRDPKSQRMIASFLVPVVILYAFFNFVIKPKVELLKTQKVELATTKKRVSDIKNKLETFEKLSADKEILVAKFDELEKLLPSKENISLLLDQFTEAENESKVYMVGFEAAEVVEKPDASYTANKYRITIESGFHQYAEFMSKVMILPRILSFSEITITNKTSNNSGIEKVEGMEDQPRNLTVECILTSYVFKEIEDGS
jgi:type IV pilus assembly protein PilO